MLVPFAQPENGVIGVAKSNYYPEVTNYTENCRRLEGPSLCGRIQKYHLDAMVTF